MDKLDLLTLTKGLSEKDTIRSHPLLAKIMKQVMEAGRDNNNSQEERSNIIELNAHFMMSIGMLDGSDLSLIPRPMFLALLVALMESVYGLGSLAGSKETAAEIVRRHRHQKSVAGKQGAEFHIEKQKAWQVQAKAVLRTLQPLGTASKHKKTGLANTLIRAGQHIKDLPTTPAQIVGFIEQLIIDGEIAPCLEDGRSKKRVAKAPS